MKMSKENWLQTEQKDRRRSFKHLEKLQGFRALSDWQKRYIKDSLFIEDRTKRESDKYEISRDHKRNWYCHIAAYTLEHEETPEQSFERLSQSEPDTWAIKEKIAGDMFIAKYLNIENPTREEVLTYLIETGFPCALLISHKDRAGDIIPFHSCIALGRNLEGDAIFWEKKSLNGPYQIVTLKDICQKYRPEEHLWGTREIEVKKEEDEE